jgi:nitrate reductase cytochrome c-type subunit
MIFVFILPGYCIDCKKKFGFLEKRISKSIYSYEGKICVECNRKRWIDTFGESKIKQDYDKFEEEEFENFLKLSEKARKGKYSDAQIELLERKELKIYRNGSKEEREKVINENYNRPKLTPYDEIEEYFTQEEIEQIDKIEIDKIDYKEYEKYWKLPYEEREEYFTQDADIFDPYIEIFERIDSEYFEKFKKLTKKEKEEVRKKEPLKFERFTARETAESLKKEKEELMELEAWEKERRTKEKIIRLRKMRENVEAGDYIPDTSREHVPRDIASYVMSRDKGRCLSCGSQENLHFDHIIPVSKGGATTAENLQILCMDCNIKKSAHI